MKPVVKDMARKFAGGAAFAFGILCVWGAYAALSSGLTAADLKSTGNQLSSASWNRVVNSVMELDGRTAQIATSWGNTGIGNPSPSAKLDVAGNVKIADGTQGAGKVLVSDAAGNASWTNSAVLWSWGASASYGAPLGTATSFESPPVTLPEGIYTASSYAGNMTWTPGYFITEGVTTVVSGNIVGISTKNWDQPSLYDNYEHNLGTFRVVGGPAVVKIGVAHRQGGTITTWIAGWPMVYVIRIF